MHVLALFGAQQQRSSSSDQATASPQHFRSISAAPRSTKLAAISIAMSNSHFYPITS
jgi:hypothetical protein